MFLWLLKYRVKTLSKSRVGEEWDKISVSEEAASDFAHDCINAEPSIYKENSQNYFSYEYILAHFGEGINDRFREDRATEHDFEISRHIADNICKKDLVLYRGVHDRTLKLMRENAVSQDADLYEKGFMACSLVQGAEINTDYRLRIFVPKGSHVIYMGNVNNEQFYYEVDIQKGARLKIVSIDHKYINCRLLGTD